MNTLITEELEDGMMMPVDVFTRLADNRILFLHDYISDKLATDICATLLLMDGESNDKITLFINSEGGECRAVFAIYDVLEMVKSEVETICIGSAMNESVLLLAAGTHRFASKNSVICPSQLIQEKYYQADLTDAKFALERIKKDNQRFLAALAKKTGKKVAEITADFDRKQYMTANQAKNYGLIDEVIAK